MEITLLTLVLCLFLVVKIPVHVGSFYWLTFLFLVYLVSYPSGPGQQLKRRIAARKTAKMTPCSHCENQVTEQDIMCGQCKLEFAYAGRHDS